MRYNAAGLRYVERQHTPGWRAPQHRTGTRGDVAASASGHASVKLMRSLDCVWLSFNDAMA